eukprot:12448509-Alexandrium_andersonii.AAC.1
MKDFGALLRVFLPFSGKGAVGILHKSEIERDYDLELGVPLRVRVVFADSEAGRLHLSLKECADQP